MGRYVEAKRCGRWALGSLVACALVGASCKRPLVVEAVPSDLDAKVTVLDSDPSPSDHKVLITAQFFTGGQFVQLAGSHVITANGTVLPFNGLAYMERVPIVAAGGSYVIVHTKGGTPTTIATITVPQRPVITSPSAGSLLPRSAMVMIAYLAGAGDHVSGRATGQKAGAGTISVGANDQPDDGSYGPLNSLGFDAGPGSLSLTRVLTPSVVGSGLNSVHVTYHIGNAVAISWQ